MLSSGCNPKQSYLFVIDGSEALRHAIDSVFGNKNTVQRCCNHKIKNVLSYLPDELKDQVESSMKAAFRLEADKGMAKLEKLAQRLDKEHASVAASLREGLSEMFTVNRLGLPKVHHRCLCTTNIIESHHSGIHQKTWRVTHWQDGRMILRWCASALLARGKNFRCIMGHQQLWMSESYLEEPKDKKIARKGKVA